MVQRVAQVNPKFILGKGKMAELEVLALEGRAGTLVFDGELSPAQLHNLADITERKVLDRTQLILDIFAQRARTKEGRLQVELAQLRYTQPRLTGKNRAMDRLMGGIGGRGPGETKLETDRRRSRERMARLRKELDQLRRQRAFTRSRRARRGIPMAALVGYTNAGKSTLLNAVAGVFPVDEGRIILAGKDITKMAEHRRAALIGRVFQDPMKGTAGNMMIEENLAMAARRGDRPGLSWSEKKEKTEEFRALLAELGLGLENRLTAHVGLLSGGQRQAVTLLMATLRRPELLLLDEHTAALDPKTAAKVLDMTERIVTAKKLTTLMITHNMRDALRFGNRLVMMHNGAPVVDVRGEEKKKLTPADLLRLFEEAGDAVSDKMMLG